MGGRIEMYQLGTPAEGAAQSRGQGGACLIIGAKLIGDGISGLSG